MYISIHTQQYVHNNMYTAIRTQQYVHNNTYTAIRIQQYVQSNTYTTIRTKQYAHNNTYTTIRTQQCVHNMYTAIRTQQYEHNNTRTWEEINQISAVHFKHPTKIYYRLVTNRSKRMKTRFTAPDGYCHNLIYHISFVGWLNSTYFLTDITFCKKGFQRIFHPSSRTPIAIFINLLPKVEGCW